MAVPKTKVLTLPISQSEMSYIADNIGSYLPPLGRKLGFDATELDDLLEYERYGVRDQANKMIHEWVKINGINATKSELIKAMAYIGRKDIADELSSDVLASDSVPIDSNDLEEELSTLKDFSTDISESDIDLVAANIGSGLHRFGVKLGLSCTDLEEIELSRYGLKDKAHKMISLWIQIRGKKATKDVLIDTLMNINRMDIADSLLSSTDELKRNSDLIGLNDVQEEPSTSKDFTTDISQSDIDFIAANIGDSLYRLGVKLGLDCTELEELELSRYGLSDRAHKMISSWIQIRGRNATKNVLIKALANIRRKDIADSLLSSTDASRRSSLPLVFDKLSMQSSSSAGLTSDIYESDLAVVADNIGPDVFQLGRQLELTTTLMTELEQGRECLKDKAHKAIRWWIRQNGNDATKQKLINAIDCIGRRDIADKLSTSKQVLSTDFTNFRQRLIELYSHLSVPQPPGIKKDIPIDKIFIDQELKIIKQSKSTLKNLQIQSLIQAISENKFLRILVEGDPGFGKTTMTVKLATDWAKGREYITSRFDLVILIPLREVGTQQLQDVIVDLINRANNKTSFTRKHWEEYLADHKVLILLDGYDEMTEDSRKLNNPVIKREDLKNTFVLVTSRRGLLTIKKSAIYSTSSLLLKAGTGEYDFWDLRVSLEGLSPEQRTKVLEHIKIESKDLKKINELFEANANELFRSPLLVFWLRWMLEGQTVQEIHTKTDFYKRLVNLILQKTLVREGIIDENKMIDVFSSTTDEVTSSLRSDIYQFGKVAMQRIISRNVLFHQSDLNFLRRSFLLKSDLFRSYKALIRSEEETYYEPMHRSFLEFLAAYSICNSKHEPKKFEDFKRTISDLIKKGVRPSMDSLLYPFVAGLLEGEAHWLFQSLSPWASLNHICQPEMINLCRERNHIDDCLIKSLIPFIPSYYNLQPVKGSVSQSYFSSPLHKRLLAKAAEDHLISVMNWKIDIDSLPVSSITLDVLRLFPQESQSNLSSFPKSTSIHCKELIYYIDTNMNSSSWKKYLSFSHSIEADQHHLFLYECSSSTCSAVLNAKTKHMFERVRIFKCCLEDEHLDAVTQWVQDNRITKGISIDLNENHKLTSDCVHRMWECVNQSPLITEFSFTNQYPSFHPSLQFTLSGSRSFQLLHFNGRFSVEHKESSGNATNIQELALVNESATNFAKALANLKGINYFECFDLCLHSFNDEHRLSNKLSHPPNELSLVITRYFNLDFSLLNLIPALTTLRLNVGDLSYAIPPLLQDYVVSVLNGSAPNLNVFAVHLIKSDSVFKFFMNCFNKIGSMKLKCLQLLLCGSWNWHLVAKEMHFLRDLLKNKNIEQLCIMELSTAALSTFLPRYFPEEEFQFKCQLLGNDDTSSIWNRQRFQHFMECVRACYITSKN